jgi:MFS family permease
MMVSSGMIYSVLPIFLFEELGANRIQVGMLFTIAATTGALTSIMLGRLSDRFGRKPLILLSQILFALVMLIYSTINYYLYAIPIHILEGFAWATIGVASPALLADIAKKSERGEAMGVYNTVWSLGWVIGPTFGGFLAEVFGFRHMLRISFLMILIGLTLTSFAFMTEITEIKTEKSKNE